MVTVADMADGKVRGYFVMGENPVVGSMHGKLQKKGLRELDWLVVRDFSLIETAEFWQDDPSAISTEVFFFPAATHTEKDGTYTNTQRLLQFHHKAVEPPGDCRSESWFMFHLGRKLRSLYRDSTDPKDAPLLELTWDYPTVGEHEEPDIDAILKEINGFTVADGSPIAGYTDLKDDGSTACGCWIYSGCNKDGVNQPALRKPASEQTWVAPDWGWAWPANRRLMYNRASADPEGKPWSERKAYVWWDDEQRKWTGHDVPDFIADRPPSYRPSRRGGRNGHHRRRLAVHHASGRSRVDLCADRAARRSASDALRAAGVAVRQPAVRPAAQPGTHGVASTRQPVSPPIRRSGASVRRHDVPADRAPHCRRDVPLAAVVVRAAAGAVL